MALIELNFKSIKYVVTRSKLDLNINFAKQYPENYLAFNDSAWDWWVYDTYEELCTAYPDYLSDMLEEHRIPPDSEW